MSARITPAPEGSAFYSEWRITLRAVVADSYPMQRGSAELQMCEVKILDEDGRQVGAVLLDSAEIERHGQSTGKVLSRRGSRYVEEVTPCE